ncbi:myocilin opposite strand [Rhinolophus ferrumequinum]|uniref:Myocilin opposite strand n=1 Tax=Rhinolophus ferrumequinum TaxID=59479 RepID=A0A7J7SXX9_RHIFE|nr:myocilin opposite strand protein [Rhinolophus ferrumequinum]KAF6293298.1 myocilin opposite strand [Rhinolophus ferrumequinum]
MAQKRPTRNGTHFPYEDLASEVTRRRVTMITREEMLTKKSDEAREKLSDLGLEQAPPAGTADPPVPPAPPPSPAEDPKVS